MPWFRSLRIPSFVLLEAYLDVRHAYKQTGGGGMQTTENCSVLLCFGLSLNYSSDIFEQCER